MSSIYRKGRDGYYYYQTYLFNPETGKKDKRVFHSLGTRNEIDAEKNKLNSIKKYEKQHRQKNNRFPILKKVYTVIIVIILISIYSYYNSALNEQNKLSKMNQQINSLIVETKSKPQNIFQHEIEKQEKSGILINNDTQIDESLLKEKVEKNKNKIIFSNRLRNSENKKLSVILTKENLYHC